MQVVHVHDIHHQLGQGLEEICGGEHQVLQDNAGQFVGVQVDQGQVVQDLQTVDHVPHVLQTVAQDQGQTQVGYQEYQDHLLQTVHG